MLTLTALGLMMVLAAPAAFRLDWGFILQVAAAIVVLGGAGSVAGKMLAWGYKTLAAARAFVLERRARAKEAEELRIEQHVEARIQAAQEAALATFTQAQNAAIATLREEHRVEREMLLETVDDIRGAVGDNEETGLRGVLKVHTADDREAFAMVTQGLQAMDKRLETVDRRQDTMDSTLNLILQLVQPAEEERRL